MKKTNQPFIEPGENYIIVEKLIPKIIEKTIKVFVEDKHAYWLKLHHFTEKIDITLFNKLQTEEDIE